MQEPTPPDVSPPDRNRCPDEVSGLASRAHFRVVGSAEGQARCLRWVMARRRSPAGCSAAWRCNHQRRRR